MTEIRLRSERDFSFPSKPVKRDVLIIGSGLAGLLLSIELVERGASVVVATKGSLEDSNTSHAQGGMAVVTGANPLDSPAQHLEDTLNSGAGLVVEEVAKEIIAGGRRLADRLSELGADFDITGAGRLDLALEGGHKQERVIHKKDATGRAISSALIDGLRSLEKSRPDNCLVLEHTQALKLVEIDGAISGAVLAVKGRPGNIMAVSSPHVVLATGGIGQIFSRTTNPDGATGDGIALAYRAGARLIDMEFVQFHPTAFYGEGAAPFLISEAVRGAGATLLDGQGVRFVKRFHPDGELATRDVVSRAIHLTMTEQKMPFVYLDLRPIGKSNLNTRFPKIMSTLASLGIDASIEPVPVSPAAHYFMGGIKTDAQGRTSLPGLYAIGECASSGLHGANRLASNSLLEAGVMAMSLASCLKTGGGLSTSDNAFKALAIAQLEDIYPITIPEDIRPMRARMYEGAGLVRSETGLEQLSRELAIKAHLCNSADIQLFEKANQLLLGKLIAQSALLRKESRGAHLRSDFPKRDDNRYAMRLSVSGGQWDWLQLSAKDSITTPANQAMVTI